MTARINRVVLTGLISMVMGGVGLFQALAPASTSVVVRDGHLPKIDRCIHLVKDDQLDKDSGGRLDKDTGGRLDKDNGGTLNKPNRLGKDGDGFLASE